MQESGVKTYRHELLLWPSEYAAQPSVPVILKYPYQRVGQEFSYLDLPRVVFKFPMVFEKSLEKKEGKEEKPWRTGSPLKQSIYFAAR